MNIIIHPLALNPEYDEHCLSLMGHRDPDESNDFANMFDGCAFE